MIRWFFIPLLALIGCLQTAPKSATDAVSGFRVYVEQNGRKHFVRARDSVITLESIPFDFFIAMPEPCDIFLSIARDSAFYKKSLNHQLSTRDLVGVGNAMADYKFNTDSSLQINSRGFSYWYFSADYKEHRYNEVIRSDDKVLCKRTVHNLHYVGSRQKRPVTKAEEMLYVVVMQKEKDSRPESTFRLHFRIKWRND